MGASFLITLREGLEAALIISIILAYLNRVNRRDRHPAVWAGAGAAVAISAVAGAIIVLVAGGLSHTTAEIFEGVASYLAVGVLTWMIFWMRRNAVHIKGELHGKVDLALASGSTFGLAALAFFVVVREGLETVLFLFSAFKASAQTPGVLKGGAAVLGLAAAVVLGFLIYRGGTRINLRLFFRITGVLILFVAASLLVYGTHELMEVGAFRFLEGTPLLAGAPGASVIMSPITRILVGLGGAPTWLEFGLFLGYLLVTGFLFFRPMSRPAAPPAPVAETQPSTERIPQA